MRMVRRVGMVSTVNPALMVPPASMGRMESMDFRVRMVLTGLLVGTAVTGLMVLRVLMASKALRVPLVGFGAWTTEPSPARMMMRN